MRSKNSSYNQILNLWGHLESSQRFKLFTLCLLILFSGFLEILTIGSVVPFMMAIVDSESLYSNPNLSKILDFFEIETTVQLIFFLSSIFAFAIISSSIARLVIAKFNFRWCYEIIASIAVKVFKVSLDQSYSFHQAKNSSETVSGIIQKTGSLLSALILPVMVIIQTSILVISVLITLFLAVDISNVFIIFLFACSYALFSIFLKKRLDTNSFIIAEHQVKGLNALQESLAGIKDLILNDGKDFYSSKFEQAETLYRRKIGENAYISVFPRFFIEAAGIVIIILIIVLNISVGQKPETILPSIAVLALSAQRVLPYLQQMYASYAAISGNKKVISDALEQLNQPTPRVSTREDGISFEKEIKFNKVFYKYPNTVDYVLKDFNLTIKKGEKIGLIGTTGCGKSTSADILMGLLQPEKGQILIDGKDLQTLNLKSWYKKISHVPQKIFISDSSIKQNIILGHDHEYRKEQRVSQALRDASLEDFVSQLPEGENTQTGEDGSLLSGGQRQRIGIARSFFKGGDLVIFDEATNALDNKTENIIVESLEKLGEDKTVVIIAHNLDTIKNCDQVVIVSEGKVVAKGPYDKISENDSFKSMIQ